jgi:hypothetical protein
MDVPHLRVLVHGRPWSSVAVDVPMDVDQGLFSSWPLVGGLSAAKHLILGQVLLDESLPALTDVACWDWLATVTAETAARQPCW